MSFIYTLVFITRWIGMYINKHKELTNTVFGKRLPNRFVEFRLSMLNPCWGRIEFACPPYGMKDGFNIKCEYTLRLCTSSSPACSTVSPFLLSVFTTFSRWLPSRCVPYADVILMFSSFCSFWCKSTSTLLAEREKSKKKIMGKLWLMFPHE